MNVYEVIRLAIINRQQIVCVYRGLYRECCPHAIGLKRDKKHVLMFQFGGQSSRGLPPDGEWRCMDIDELDQVSAQDGEWYTDPRHSKPQTCIDAVDVDVTMALT